MFTPGYIKHGRLLLHHAEKLFRYRQDLLSESTASDLKTQIKSLRKALRARNEAAYGFYRALGFAETLRLPGYYLGRETAIRMMRLLRMPNAVVPAWRPPTRDRR